MRHYNIIARTNGVGLDRDVSLLRDALTAAGHQVSVSHCRAKKWFHKFLPKQKQFDVNIFIERIFPHWLGVAKKNILIPNQERFPHRHVSRLEKIDLVLCKSQHAKEIFHELGCKTKFISFTSQDLHLNDEIPDYQRYFHLAGRSTLKGTETLLKVWSKHPEWPRLTLVQHKENAPNEVPENVNLVTDYLPHDELIKLCNKSGVHLCPSISEGWGHYIAEAMSCKAVVVTTNAPPMNELVTSERGVLVDYEHLEPRHLGTNFYVSDKSLEAAITHVLKLTSEQKQAMGMAGRLWFEKNHQRFRSNIEQLCLNNIL